MATTTYAIKPGDTAASIAAKLNIPVDVLIRYNPTIEHNGKRVPLNAGMALSNGTLYYPGAEPVGSTLQNANNPPNTGSGDPLLDELQGLPGQERDAYAALKTLFESYGLGSLAPKILQ